MKRGSSLGAFALGFLAVGVVGFVVALQVAARAVEAAQQEE